MTALVPASLNLDLRDRRLLEVMTVPLPDTDGCARAGRGVERVLERAERADALVLGPGLGRADGALEFARQLAAGRAASRCCSTPTG